MPRTRYIENRIKEVEGFCVLLTDMKGRNVRGDKVLPTTYPYKRKAKGSLTVQEFCKLRILKTFPGYQAKVLDSNGNPVRGNLKLSTVRKSYTAASIAA